MAAVDLAALKKVLDVVEPRLKAAEAELGPPGGYDPGYWERRRRAMDACAQDLRDQLGARINDKWDGCRVRIAGLHSTSTTGMAGALNNWMTAARRRLSEDGAR